MSLVAHKIKNPMGIVIKYMLKNGSTVFDILTHEQDTEQFEGWKGHIAWFDPNRLHEVTNTSLPYADWWISAVVTWLTLTPLTQPCQIYDDIYTKADGKRIFVVTVDIRENTHLDEASMYDNLRKP